MLLRQLNRIISSNYQSYIPKLLCTTLTTSNIIDKWKTKFENEQIPDVQTSLDNILGRVLKQRKVYGLSKNKSIILSKEQISKFEDLCECRLARMPIQYIVGEWEFRDLILKMQPPVFIPRPETEELVELILQQQLDAQKAIRFLEIGCGSGAISLALLRSLPNAQGIAIDQSSMACMLTMENACSLKLTDRLTVSQHKLTDKIKDNEFKDVFNLIVSNPPYVPTNDLLNLDSEIRLYEDLRALDGGQDGLALILPILRVASKYLKPNGTLWLEVDPSHPSMIASFLDKNYDALKLKFVASYPDLFQNERFVEIVKQ